MDFSLTDEQELLLESIDEFAQRYFSDEEAIKSWYKNYEFPIDICEAYRDAGFAFMGLPEEVGGVPCDHLTLGLMTERLYHKTGCYTPFMTTMLSTYDVVKFGTKEQADMIMAEYDKNPRQIICLAASEPAAGSDNAGMTSTAKKQADGTYVLNGQKTWVTNGAITSYLLVIAKDEDPSRENKDFSLWIVPTNSEGISFGHFEKYGQQVCPFVDVYMDNVKLTEDMRLGEAGKGWLMLMKNFEFERCLVVAQSLGLAEAALDDMVNYANEREVFGKPISTNPLIRDRIVESQIIVNNVKSELYRCLWMLDQGMSINEEVACLKYYATKGCSKVVDTCITIYGSLGYTTEVRAGRIYGDLRGNEIGGGTCEVMSYIAGRSICKRYKK